VAIKSDPVGSWPWLVHQLPRPSRHFLHHAKPAGNMVQY